MHVYTYVLFVHVPSEKTFYLLIDIIFSKILINLVDMNQYFFYHVKIKLSFTFDFVRMWNLN